MQEEAFIDSAAQKISAGISSGTAWKLRYWSIFIGQSVSLLGSSMTQFVLLWWITDTTGSVAALAAAGLVALLPQALLAPLGGIFADRYSRRLIIIAADMISASCMAIIILLFLYNNVQIWHLYIMMFIRSSMQALQQPAIAASAAMLVPESFLPRAAGLNQLLVGVMTIGAAPLGALIISILPIGQALSIDLVTAIIGIAPLIIFSIPQVKNAPEGPSSILREFYEGAEIVWGNPVLLRLYGMIAAIMIAVIPALTLIQLLVKEHFGGGPEDVAIIESLAGFGMMVGGGVIVAMAPKKRVRWVVCGFGVSSLAVASTALAPSELFWLAALSWALAAAAFAMGNASFTTILQVTVPNNLQGRVLSLLTMLMGVSAPIGLIVVMPIGEVIGVRWLFVFLGFAGFSVACLGYFSPTMRRVDMRAN